MGRINTLINKLDKAHLEWLGFLVMAVLLAPILVLYARDGAGSGVFFVHDQLDETILSYVFGARYFGQSVYEQMMCGIDAVGLKPSAPLFIPLYGIFSVYNAFLIQYAIVVATAFFGMYFLVRYYGKSSIAAIGAATLFAFLPFHSIYGNVVSGTPLLLLCLFGIRTSKGKKTILYLLGLVYYAMTAHIVLTGWVALGIAVLMAVVFWIKDKAFPFKSWLAFLTLFVTYVIINIDLILQSVFHSGVVSHRNEFADASVETSFFSVLKDIFSRGDFHHDAYTRHMFILFPVLAAIVLLVTCKAVRKHTFAFCLCAGTLVVFAAAEAFFSSSVSAGLMNILPGMFKSFQFDRTYYFLPGLWYILLGLSFAIVLELFKEKWAVLGIIAVGIFSMVILKDVAKDEEGIFYQNINQVNNGESVTGYITMKNLYSEPLMAEIEETIGRDMKDYRVAHIGISPVAALLHGFYTIDGYSNNYSLAYKHEFRKIIEKELELNDFNRAYFDDWGSRCYIFYHEWGNAYLLKKGFSGTITDLRLDFAKMKELNCDFIFSAGEIIDAEQYGLLYRGYYSTDDSYWGIYLYELN